MKIALSLALCIAMFGIFSCTQKTDDVHNHITIDIEKPTDNGVVANASAVEIDIDLTAEVELHDVEISLKDSANNAIPPFNPMDAHVHAKTHHVHETVDLSSYPSGSKFSLSVEACEDHDCTDKETKTINFSI